MHVDELLKTIDAYAAGNYDEAATARGWLVRPHVRDGRRAGRRHHRREAADVGLTAAFHRGLHRARRHPFRRARSRPLGRACSRTGQPFRANATCDKSRPRPPHAPALETSLHCSDEALVARIARGDEAAFAELYDRLGALAYSLAVRILRNPSLAEEATQEAFVAVWRNAARFDARRGSARAWVLLQVRARSIDRVRHEERRGGQNEQVDAGAARERRRRRPTTRPGAARARAARGRAGDACPTASAS